MLRTRLASLLSELLPKLICSTHQSSFIADQIYDSYFRNFVNQDKIERRLPAEVVKNCSPSPPRAYDCDNDVWIFGYGSLVWKADFPFIDRRRGFIVGYQRRFYQHSIDHRGTPEKPGRVVTLLPTNNATDRVYGVAYRIAAEEKLDVLKHLDYREKNGYERRQLIFHEFPESNDNRFNVIMYVATNENDSYAGKVWQLPLIAEQIVTSAGPSGPNREYLFNLTNAMREHFPGVTDDHLQALEAEVIRLIEEKEMPSLERALKREIGRILDQARADMKEITLETLLSQLMKLEESCKNNWRERILAEELLQSQAIS